MKWLYFRQSAGLGSDNGLISHHAGTNSTLRTSALLKYENLQSIIPFNASTDEEPNGATTLDYIGVVMIFKSDTVSLGQDGFGTVKFIAADKVYLQTTVNSASTCIDIINFIESSKESVVTIADVTNKFLCPSILTVKHIEIAQNHRLT
tara:strand:- start:173 stop:619 length:447 start_codon:yes stop_codon:yes gene_type:complete